MMLPGSTDRKEFEEAVMQVLRDEMTRMAYHKGWRVLVCIAGEPDENDLCQVDSFGSTFENRNEVIAFIQEHSGVPLTPIGVTGYIDFSDDGSKPNANFWLNEHGIVKRGVHNKPPESPD